MRYRIWEEGLDYILVVRVQDLSYVMTIMNLRRVVANFYDSKAKEHKKF